MAYLAYANRRIGVHHNSGNTVLGSCRTCSPNRIATTVSMPSNQKPYARIIVLIVL